MPLLKIKFWRAQEEEVWNLTMTALLAMIFINLKCLRRAMCRHICHQHASECHQISNVSLGKHRFYTAKKQECSKSGWEISLQKIGREPQKFLITLAEGFCCKWVSSDMKECWHVRSWHHWNNTKTRKLNPRDEMHYPFLLGKGLTQNQTFKGGKLQAQVEAKVSDAPQHAGHTSNAGGSIYRPTWGPTNTC